MTPRKSNIFSLERAELLAAQSLTIRKLIETCNIAFLFYVYFFAFFKIS